MDEVNVAVIAPILGRDLSFVSDVDAASLGVLLVAYEFSPSRTLVSRTLRRRSSVPAWRPRLGF